MRRRVLKAGAAGYLTKRSAAEALMQAIRQVAQGKTYLEPSIAQQLALQQLNGEKSPVDMLSEKEFKVFLALAKGTVGRRDRRDHVAQPAHGRNPSI